MRKQRRRRAGPPGAAAVRTRWARAAMSGWRPEAVRIARVGRSSLGGARADWRGSAAKLAGATFNALTKTSMARLRKRERWLDHARAMIEGKSLAKTAALCGVHPATAFRWRHRFLGAPAADKPQRLSGVVEADETFILESFKGRRSDLL